MFETFRPQIPAAYRDSEFVFLGNIDPELQAAVVDQVPQRRFVGCDTMNFWIETRSEALRHTLTRVDALVINDQEIWQVPD